MPTLEEWIRCDGLPAEKCEEYQKKARLRDSGKTVYRKTRDDKQKPPVVLDCQHRGAVIRQDVGNLCGIRGSEIDIYSCEVHGECSLSRYCRNQEVPTCVLCEDRKFG